MYGHTLKTEIADGVEACARIWDFKKEPYKDFHAYCLEFYIANRREKNELLLRLNEILGLIYGSFGVINKSINFRADIADFKLSNSEILISKFSVSTHLTADLQSFKIAHLIQLNFGTKSKKPCNNEMAWLARRVSKIGLFNIPAKILGDFYKAQTRATEHIVNFNIYLDKIKYHNSKVVFPRDTVRLSHWGLRDLLTSFHHQKEGLAKQKAIFSVLQASVNGDLPREIINSNKFAWDQKNGTLLGQDSRVSKATALGDGRWQLFAEIAKLRNKMCQFQTKDSFIDYKFNFERELSKKETIKNLTSILACPQAKKVAKLLENKLGRKLEPFDIYYRDFASDTDKANAKLKFNLNKRYPNVAAIEKDIPNILKKLGFDINLAKKISSTIKVHNSRTAGHAVPAASKEDFQYLRVHVSPHGFNEQEFSIFMHELGHSTEQAISSNFVPSRLLWGVPNIAFTEAFAFIFQAQSNYILGRSKKINLEISKNELLQIFWKLFEIAGPSLLEIYLWEWLGRNPKASAKTIHNKVLSIARNIWGEYYAPIFGKNGFEILGAYSHMFWGDAYLADYPLGHIISYQIRKHLNGKNLAKEMLKLCRQGSIHPQAWLRNGINQEISVKPLLSDLKIYLSNAHTF